MQASDPGLKVSALKALMRIGDHRAASEALSVAEDPDESFGVRATAAEAALRLGAPRAVVVLGSLVTEPDIPHRSFYWKWALRLIREFGGVEVIPVFEQARAPGLLGRYRLTRTVRALRNGEQSPSSDADS